MNNEYEQCETFLRITARYVEEVEAGLQPRVSDYVARYPQYAAAIADFVAYYHAVEVHAGYETGSASECPPLSAISQAALERAGELAPTSDSSGKPLSTLLLSRRNQPVSLTQLAHRLAVSEDVALRLEFRQIEPDTLPQAVLRRLAVLMYQPVNRIQAYLALPPRLISQSVGLTG
jgi:hypothetical protein